MGGKDNFASDREVGEQILQFLPNMRTAVRADRAFLGRAVRYLAGEAGIRQFLDVGTGLPTADNTHDVAQSVAPQSRIVYIDNDPLVLVHARALLTSTPEGVTDYVEAGSGAATPGGEREHEVQRGEGVVARGISRAQQRTWTRQHTRRLTRLGPR